MATLFSLLTVVAAVSAATISVLAVAGRNGFPGVRDAVWETLGPSALWLAFLVALTATLGSLYLSEIAHFVPCKLCWYQRIAMYPLVVLLLVAAIKHSAVIARATLPLVVIGALLSTYHYLVERFPSLDWSATCDPIAPCTIVWVWRFQYLSLPAMAFSGFLLIGMLVLLAPSEEG